ncbi:MAG TPA: hypothetical protein VIF10_02735 [Methylobacter sp.]|jgi:hypothetical protein
MTRFVVDLGKVQLSDTQKAEISASIQKAVLGHLANIPSASENAFSLGSIGKRPPWLGLILRESLEEVVEAANIASKQGHTAG